MAAPWFKFYPSDWRADPALRMCSLAARGLWMEMLCLMHEASPRGSLLINGLPVSTKQLASLVGVSEREIVGCLGQLESAGVFSREDSGTIYSRRMRRDDEKAARDKANGKGGGNPSLKPGVNPPVNGEDKAQKPEARKKEGASAPCDEEKDFFARGKSVLGERSGGLLAKLLKAQNGKVPLARAVIERASTKQNPTEYVGAVVRGAVAPGPADGWSAIL